MSTDQKDTAAFLEMQLAASSDGPSSSFINDEKDTLELLAVLPDVFQLLFLQLGEDLKSFDCFKKLPMELRLMVWRLSFPRDRLVDMNEIVHVDMDHFRRGLPEPDCEISRGTERNCPFPATLHINQESRKETLNHYCVVLRPEGYSQKLETLCYNPGLDTLFFSLKETPELRKWIELLQEASPRLFSLIEKVEIRNQRPCLAFFETPGFGNVKGMELLRRSLVVLSKFSGLKYLKYVKYPFANGYPIWPAAVIKDQEDKIISAVGDCLKSLSVWAIVPTVSAGPPRSIMHSMI
ncbi:uncharacterized protein RAG0_10265 [Rhynchosporium agropyri]|uniref:2EXR domain-containing protein n=1 Tax=Rhynchosporium agropyri TaxID=914238 RepID=A0A1E1KZ65_9HELO|nr:uncharacterized protein RAG0_10265 [Rhynchosporium agropyri]